MSRLAWWLALAFLAAVAVFAQLDRASEKSPALALAVPAPMRSVAQVPTTMLALTRNDPAAAREEAARLVRRRPMPAEHLFLLAMAELRVGAPGGYSQAFLRATERGWRVKPVQQAAARAALARGDANAAANRIAALWAVDASDDALPELTRVLLATDGGPDAFAAKVAGTKVWQNVYLQRAAQFAPSEVTRSVIVRAEQRGASFDCGLLERSTHLRGVAPGPNGARPNCGDGLRDRPE